MAESRWRYLLALILVLALVPTARWLWREPEADKSVQTNTADSERQIDAVADRAEDISRPTEKTSAVDGSNSKSPALDCSGDFDALIGQYRPELASRLKRLDADRRFIESSGPFIGSFGELGKLSYPGYESYDTDTLLRLGDNGDQIAQVIYAAHQIEEVLQKSSNIDDFDSEQFDRQFRRLQHALEAGQTGALYIAYQVQKLRALRTSKRVQHDMPLSNRAAVIEAQAWQLATARVGTLAERAIAQHFGDALDKGSFQLMNDNERQQLKQRSEELLAGTLRNLRHPISEEERQTEAALAELFTLIEDPALATLHCRDGRTLQGAINETFIND